MSKDLFSSQSAVYAKFRPSYPRELFDHILSFVSERRHAWDCATGNGQAAVVLSDHFEKVEATDISAAQLSNAIKKENIGYRIASAEKTPFADNSFDLITVAQAYHWINWKAFHDEASRVGKNKAVVAVWCYSLMQTGDARLDELIVHFYRDIVGPYWDAARKFVDDHYATVAFNFDPLPSKPCMIRVRWMREHFIGYLGSWSAVQAYIKKNQTSPIDVIRTSLESLWREEEEKAIEFPLYMRIGRIRK
ncbi:MAG TPA: class I SAM-dependent methyltransferase [Flavisolibacter sp.]|nr:class I SAM-dependent methyltransferase [Flavisolibacter sp.]